MSIGKQISVLRKERGMSQETLADLLFVSRDLVAKWESGTRRPDYAMIEKIAETFEVPPDSVFEKSAYIFDELSSSVPETVSLSGDEITNALNVFLRGVKERDAAIFIRRYYLLETVSEISAFCGIKENAIRSLLSRTRKRFARYLRERKI
ncbi:MAG: helix-turn-helix transcriptional regulator [Clostridia bacterium]|nr:helix-turn-helix transcriptional regulator [Clostridia bacterium]